MLAAGDKITTLDHSLSAAPPGIASPNFGGNQRSSETLANLPIEHIIGKIMCISIRRAWRKNTPPPTSPISSVPRKHIDTATVARHARPLDATMSYTRLYEHETVQ